MLDALVSGLTEEQAQAVAHASGPLLVLAGPGSGKTTVVTRRIAALVARGHAPWQILALTFTNKAAGEMRSRVDDLLAQLGLDARGLVVSTFHAFCARVLRTWGAEAGIGTTFTIYDTADQREAIRQAIRLAGLSEEQVVPSAVAASISAAKNELLDAAAHAEQAQDWRSRLAARVHAAYERVLRANDAVDFDDLLLLVARMVRAGGPALDALRARYEHLLIDEYQDTNHAQFAIADALAAVHRNIAVVGDPDQSIYAWRGADISNILDFESRYPDAVVVPLGRNFRSTGHIVAAADSLIRRNLRRKHKDLSTALGAGERPTIAPALDEHAEAELVAEWLVRRRREHGTPWSEMAVLYRMNALSRVLEAALRTAGVPYVVARGTAFYERKEIKDALAYLRLAANPGDEIALARAVATPPRGIGATSLERMRAWAGAHDVRLFDAFARAAEAGAGARAAKSCAAFATMVEGWRRAAQSAATDLGGLVDRVLRESGLEGMYREAAGEDEAQRRENLAELVSAASEFVPPESEGPDAEAFAGEGLLPALAAFLQAVALVADADAVDPERGAVTLLTLHAAKGLEFDAVAIVGCDEGLLPHARAEEDPAALEEERRLCFVGITRARRALLLARAAARLHRGMRMTARASRFLQELDPDAVEVLRDPHVSASVRAFLEGSRPLLERGTLVRHPTLGIGRVRSVVHRGAGSSAEIDFERSGVRTVLLEHSDLETLGEIEDF